MKNKFLLVSLSAILVFNSPVWAGSAREIDASVQSKLEIFREKVPGITDVLANAKAVLVIPGIWKAGFVLGGLYGEGSLLVGGRPVDYYSLAGATLGFQMGIQKMTLIMLFMDQDAYYRFRDRAEWEFGVDGSVALITVGADGQVNSMNQNKPIMTYVIDQKGLMYNLNLEGYKLTKLKK